METPPIGFVAPDPNEELGKRLRRERIDVGMTQQDIADICGVDQEAVSRWENNHRPIPFYNLLKASTAIGLARIIGAVNLRYSGRRERTQKRRPQRVRRSKVNRHRAPEQKG